MNYLNAELKGKPDKTKVTYKVGDSKATYDQEGELYWPYAVSRDKVTKKWKVDHLPTGMYMLANRPKKSICLELVNALRSQITLETCEYGQDNFKELCTFLDQAVIIVQTFY